MTEHPRKTIFEINVPAVAQGSDDNTVALVAPFAGAVEAVEYVPKATLTGADTNSRTCSLINKGQAGAGSTSVAAKAFVSGVNAPAFDSTEITLSGTEANLNVAAGDVLAWNSAKVATGLADPGGMVRITVAKS